MTRAASHTKLLTGGLSYWEYQRRVGAEAVIPWLERRLPLDGLAVADFGAHEGGVLDAFREHGAVAGGTGFELNEAVVARSRFVPDERFRLLASDLTLGGPADQSYDLVLLHDVLEHVPAADAVLAAVVAALRPGGHAFVSFPPYWSAFGGHQQLARSAARLIPFVHVLPAPLFYRIARPAANEYMSADDSLADLRSVRRTRLTLRRAEGAFAAAGLELVARELFFLRPEYTIRYGIPALPAGPLGRLPAVREAAVNGAYYLLRAAPAGVRHAGDVT